MRRIPIRFADEILEDELDQESKAKEEQAIPGAQGGVDVISIAGGDVKNVLDDATQETEEQAAAVAAADEKLPADVSATEVAGPVFAELLATRAELKRVEAEAGELRDAAARRQADFENFRKRIERERAETYNRAVADLVTKLLPVLDNLRRAVDTEASVEATESDEFRHFLNGVDLIHKQLNGVLEALGVKQVKAVGELFDPHLHEAVVTEETDQYEPDTVVQEIVRGYRLGDKLLRPALVKVAVKK